MCYFIKVISIIISETLFITNFRYNRKTWKKARNNNDMCICLNKNSLWLVYNWNVTTRGINSLIRSNVYNPLRVLTIPTNLLLLSDF
ncbi:hypothetical protein L1887_00102 [Cichorium endivia]|nr:hypothetical protein L1887_00102 [Cichorium endivia]